MTGPELPTTLISLAGYTIFIAAPLAAALIKIRLELKADRASATKTRKDIMAAVGKIDEIHDQAVNGHLEQTNLRSDVDIARDASVATHNTTGEIYNVVRDIQERQMAQGRELNGMRTDMAGVRADMTGIRTDLTGVSRELHDERTRSIDTDASLWKAIRGFISGGGGDGS